MAKKFACEHCGAAIVTRFLDVGDEALCSKCGGRTPVPESTENVAGAADSGSVTTGTSRTGQNLPKNEETLVTEAHAILQRENFHPTTRLYSKRAIFWFSFFFTVFAGGLLLAANWRRLGRHDKSRQTLLVTGTIALAILVLAFIIPEHHSIARLFRILHVVLAIAIRYHVENEQGEILRAFKRIGGVSAPVGRPLMLAFGCTLPLLTIILLSAYFEDDFAMEDHFNAGMDYYTERNELDSALMEFRLALDLAPDNPVCNAVVGECYLHLDNSDSAFKYLKCAIELDSTMSIAHYDIAMAHYFRGEYRESWEAIQKSRSLGKDNVNLYFERTVRESLNVMSADSL